MGRHTQAFLGADLRLTVTVAENANRDNPIAMDVVLVSNYALLTKLAEMPAAEWYEKREQVNRDFLEGIKYWSWEWVPGQTVPELKVPIVPNAVGGLIFARYSSPGSHRNRIDPFAGVTVRLLENGFVVEK